MAFTDLNFLSRFLPLVMIIYFLSPRRYQIPVLFVGSLVFYSLGDWKWLPLLLLLCGVNYLFARRMAPLSVENLPENGVQTEDSVQRRSPRKKELLAGILLIDAGVLVLFKVLLAGYGLALPLGISFYIFKMLSFQIDLYRGKIGAAPSLLVTATYFCLFFQIAQGPIMRFSEESFGGNRRRFSLVGLEDGLKYLILGLSMKLLVADRLAILWNEAVKIGFESLSTPLAWLATIGYSLELYLDFWGYSLMAAGIGVMLGFPFVENFRHPFAAASVGEFYRRWHITLTSWFKEYVYIPIGASRATRERTVCNILIVWLLTGLWHGGGMHFVVWGLMLGALIAGEKFVYREWLLRYPLAGHIYTLAVLPLTWAAFAAGNMTELGTLLRRLLPVTGHVSGANAGDFGRYLVQYLPYLCVAIALCVPRVYDWIAQKREGRAKLIEAGVLVALLWMSLYAANTSQANPFLYFYF